MYFGLRANLKNKFSVDELKKITLGKSILKEPTFDLCKFQILGDPKEVGNYVKIQIICDNGQKAISTMSLSAVEDKSVKGVINEYSRIVGFDVNELKKQKYQCYLDGKLLSEESENEIIRPTSTLSCNNLETNEK